MTQEELDKIRFAATVSGELDKYVYLREDSEGMYVEYAFIEGAPHDNRCLSWYDSYQEEAYIRNGWGKELSEEDRKSYLAHIKKKRDEKVGKLFELSSFTCGWEENPQKQAERVRKLWEECDTDGTFIPEEHVCKVGSPSKRCLIDICKHWTYKEPVKCACWHLIDVTIPTHVTIPIDLAMSSIKI